MTEWKKYRRKGDTCLRPYVIGEDLKGVSISDVDLIVGSPKEGDMIARNPKNHDDQWLVSAKYFAENFEPVGVDWLGWFEALAKECEFWKAKSKASTVKATNELIFSDKASNALAGKKLVVSIGDPEAFEKDDDDDE